MTAWLLAVPAAAGLLGGSWWLKAALVFLILLAALFGWFYRWSLKHFGGITGDLAGFYLQAGELVCLSASVALLALRG